MSNITTKTTEKTANVFSKEQLVRSKRFSGSQDLLEAALSSDRKYTIGEVDGIISSYKKGKVK